MKASERVEKDRKRFEKVSGRVEKGLAGVGFRGLVTSHHRPLDSLLRTTGRMKQGVPTFDEHIKDCYNVFGDAPDLVEHHSFAIHVASRESSECICGAEAGVNTR